MFVVGFANVQKTYTRKVGVPASKCATFGYRKAALSTLNFQIKQSKKKNRWLNL